MSDDLTTSRLRKSLDLARSVDNDVIYLRLLALDKFNDLVELGCEKVQASQNCTVGSKRVLLDDLLILDRVTDVYVAWVRHL